MEALTLTNALTTCPGCGHPLAGQNVPPYDGYYNVAPECWAVYTKVLGEEFGNAVLFGQVHQLTVDTFAIQHAGGPHPDKSVGIHLSGLYLVKVAGLKPAMTAPLLQRLANSITTWPHFVPPASRGDRTVHEVAAAVGPIAHAEAVEAWSDAVWECWSLHHDAVASLVQETLKLD